MITQGTGAGYTYMGCSSEAGKTGTSEGESDAWFVGYTPLYSTAVWVGHPQSREATGFGGPTAGPIWQSFMSAAQEGDCPEFEVPASLPELSGLDSEHTSSSGYSSGDEEEESYEGEEEEKDGGKGRREGSRRRRRRRQRSGTGTGSRRPPRPRHPPRRQASAAASARAERGRPTHRLARCR